MMDEQSGKHPVDGRANHRRVRSDRRNTHRPGSGGVQGPDRTLVELMIERGEEGSRSSTAESDTLPRPAGFELVLCPESEFSRFAAPEINRSGGATLCFTATGPETIIAPTIEQPSGRYDLPDSMTSPGSATVCRCIAPGLRETRQSGTWPQNGLVVYRDGRWALPGSAPHRRAVRLGYRSLLTGPSESRAHACSDRCGTSAQQSVAESFVC